MSQPPVQYSPEKVKAVETLQRVFRSKYVSSLVYSTMFEMCLYNDAQPVLPYDVKSGLQENDCTGNFVAMFMAIQQKDHETIRDIAKFIKKTYPLEYILNVWETIVRQTEIPLKSMLVARQICNFVGQCYPAAFMAAGYPVASLMKLLQLLLISCSGAFLQVPNMQMFLRDLSTALAVKKGLELTGFLLRQPVDDLVRAVRCFSHFQDKDFGTETLDILAVTRNEEFKLILSGMTVEKRRRFNELVLGFGHAACANLLLDVVVKPPTGVPKTKTSDAYDTKIMPFAVFSPVSDYPLPTFTKFVEEELDATLVVSNPVEDQPIEVGAVEQEDDPPCSSKRRGRAEKPRRRNRPRLSDNHKNSRRSAD